MCGGCVVHPEQIVFAHSWLLLVKLSTLAHDNVASYPPMLLALSVGETVLRFVVVSHMSGWKGFLYVRYEANVCHLSPCTSRVVGFAHPASGRDCQLRRMCLTNSWELPRDNRLLNPRAMEFRVSSNRFDVVVLVTAGVGYLLVGSATGSTLCCSCLRTD